MALEYFFFRWVVASMEWFRWVCLVEVAGVSRVINSDGLFGLQTDERYG